MKYQLEPKMLGQFRRALLEEERSEATIKKYLHDITVFCDYAKHADGVDKELVIAYKKSLLERYTISSANSMLAALNRFLNAWAGMIV